MDHLSMIGLLAAAGGVGLLIGAVGVGGILLIPLFGAVANLPVHEAMATALATFVATGIVGTWLFQRKGSIDWRLTIPVCAGALPFGFAGAYVNSIANASSLTALIAAITLGAGVYTLAQWRGLPRPVLESRPDAQWWLLLGVGVVCGFGAGLAGVGGPVLSVPIMVLLGFPVLPAIGVSQVLQILAAGSGTLGNLAYGAIDFRLALPVAALEVLGVVAGVFIVHAIDVRLVRRIVAVVCILVGVWMLRDAGRSELGRPNVEFGFMAVATGIVCVGRCRVGSTASPCAKATSDASCAVEGAPDARTA